jgi:uncharacterized protein
MENERAIGKVVSVDSLNVYIKLNDDLKSLYKSGYSEIYPVARINSYIIIPVGVDRIVAMVNRVQTREETNIGDSNKAIFLTNSSRYLSATMVGTIEENEHYLMGVYNYPILDNPVWYIVREDLEKIFDQKKDGDTIDYENDYYLPIGTSPAFPDFKVKINPDRFFGKHAAILGNTGSGKSCTLVSLIQSMFSYKYNGNNLKSAHFIIFDTNGEYKKAFDIKEDNIVNPFHISQEGMKVPHWFMNYDDMDYLFEPTSGSQAPVLKRAVSLGKNGTKASTQKVLPPYAKNKLSEFINILEKANFNTKYALLDDLPCVISLFEDIIKDRMIDFDMSSILNILNEIKTDGIGTLSMGKKYLEGQYSDTVILKAIKSLKEEIQKYENAVSNITTSENRNLDLPLFYNFNEMLHVYMDEAIKESDTSEDRLREYVSTLKNRMQSFLDDKRMATPLLFDAEQDITDGLVKFLAFILGDFCKIYNAEGNDVYTKYYKDKTNTQNPSQITIIDMSLLPNEVLETMTGLIGRIILEFLSRFGDSDRGTMPVVIALEEAQNYIPEINKKDRTSISRKVFERIAREGRKYGLSLVISSQRPSELSKTVLSQCNSFIIHRLQNPDDQIYVRKLVSAASSEILSQLPILPQQHAIVMGDAVRTPVMTRINTASPRPKSDNPKFVENWLKEGKNKEQYKTVIDKWLEKSDKEQINDIDNESK